MWCYLWFPCIRTQISALRCTDMRTLSTIPGFTQVPWYAFSTRCRNTSKSLIGSECTHSQNSRGMSSGDHAGQLTESPRPIHWSPKVWLRRCLTVRRKWGDAPSLMNHMCCWWRRTCYKITGESFTKKRRYATPVSLLHKTTGCKCWPPKIPTQALTRS
jgi:hypothetical protein